MMFESLRLPGLRHHSSLARFGVSETRWHGRRLTMGIALGGAAAAMALLLSTRTPAPRIHSSTQALAPAPLLTAPSRYEAACARGDSDACNRLGVLYREGREVAQDPVTAVAFFSNACGSGHADACNNLGADRKSVV